MKYLLLLLSFFCLERSYSQTDKSISLIKIVKTDFNIETIVSVSCEQFNSMFPKEEIDTFYIYDKLRQQKIFKFINSAKIRKEYRQPPDTRARMFIYYKSGKVDSICLSGTTIFSLNDKVMLLPNRGLIEMLERLKK